MRISIPLSNHLFSTSFLNAILILKKFFCLFPQHPDMGVVNVQQGKHAIGSPAVPVSFLLLLSLSSFDGCIALIWFSSAIACVILRRSSSLCRIDFFFVFETTVANYDKMYYDFRSAVQKQVESLIADLQVACWGQE